QGQHHHARVQPARRRQGGVPGLARVAGEQPDQPRPRAQHVGRAAVAGAGAAQGRGADRGQAPAPRHGQPLPGPARHRAQAAAAAAAPGAGAGAQAVAGQPALRRQQRVDGLGHPRRPRVRRVQPVLQPVQRRVDAGQPQAQLHAHRPVDGVAVHVPRPAHVAARRPRAVAAAPARQPQPEHGRLPGQAGRRIGLRARRRHGPPGCTVQLAGAGPAVVVGGAGGQAKGQATPAARPRPAPPRRRVAPRPAAQEPGLAPLALRALQHCRRAPRPVVAQDRHVPDNGLPADALRGLPGRHAVRVRRLAGHRLRRCAERQAAGHRQGVQRLCHGQQLELAGLARRRRHRLVRLRVRRQGRPRVCQGRAHSHPEQGQRRLVVRLHPARGWPRVHGSLGHVPAQPRQPPL
ncbi:hypothetical protein IWQ56_003589, partial [Coemansia nantahalensis]